MPCIQPAGPSSPRARPTARRPHVSVLLLPIHPGILTLTSLSLAANRRLPRRAALPVHETASLVEGACLLVDRDVERAETGN